VPKLIQMDNVFNVLSAMLISIKHALKLATNVKAGI